MRASWVVGRQHPSPFPPPHPSIQGQEEHVALQWLWLVVAQGGKDVQAPWTVSGPHLSRGGSWGGGVLPHCQASLELGAA